MELALNSIAYLSTEEDLLGIKPKSWSDSIERMTSYQMRGVVLGGFSIPLFMLIFAILLSYRRKNM